MKKNPQTTEQLQVSTQTKNPSVLQKLRSGFLNKYTAIIIGTAALTGCGTDDPIEEQLNSAPVNNITVTVGDYDNDGKLDDVRVTNTVTDADTGDTIQQTLSVTGKPSVNKTGRTATADFFNVAKGSVVGEANSSDGLAGDTDTKTVNIIEEDDNFATTYQVTNTVTPVTADVPEETAAKLADFTTLVEKITSNNGVETNRETVANPTLVHSEFDASNYEVNNGEFLVKEAGVKDADNADGSNIPDADREYAETVKTEFTAPDGTVYADTDPVNKEFTDTDDFAPFPGLVVEHNGDIRPEYTNTVAMANSLEWNYAERTNLVMLNNIAAAAGADFTRTTFNIAGLNYSYLTYQGQRIDGLTMSRILDAYYEARDSSQTLTFAEMVNTTDFKNYLATALQNSNYVTYNGTPGANDYDAGGEISLSIPDAAKVGAATTVTKNIADGLY